MTFEDLQKIIPSSANLVFLKKKKIRFLPPLELRKIDGKFEFITNPKIDTTVSTKDDTEKKDDDMKKLDKGDTIYYYIE